MRSYVIFTVLFIGLSANAFSTLKIDCSSDGISISGILVKTQDTLSGDLNLAGAAILSELQGSQAFAGQYTYLPAGSFYKTDLEMIKLYSTTQAGLYFESKTIGKNSQHRFSVERSLTSLNCSIEKN